MSSPTVVIVEDEAIVGEDIKIYLTNQGCSIRGPIASGKRAIKDIPDIHPDMVLMDIALQDDVSGLDVTIKLKGKIDCPIVFMTAYAQEQTAQKMKRTEALGYLKKPVDEMDLDTLVEWVDHDCEGEIEFHQGKSWTTS